MIASTVDHCPLTGGFLSNEPVCFAISHSPVRNVNGISLKE